MLYISKFLLCHNFNLLLRCVRARTQKRWKRRKKN